jgi:hypothetical protein
MEININNLTEEQKEMLDFMWNELNTLEDFENWLECLSTEDQAQAITLQRLILLEAMEEFLEDTTVATNYLKKFQLQ